MAEGRRGAPRSEASRIAILAATAEQFAERGWEHLTIEGIAAAAGVGKQTIYRWWPSKSALVAECLFEGRILPGSFIPPDTGDVRADFTSWINEILAFAATAQGADLFRSLIAAAADDEEVGARLRDSLGGQSPLTARLDSARAADQLTSVADVEFVGEALLGAIVLRLITRSQLEPEQTERFVDSIFQGRGRVSGAE